MSDRRAWLGRGVSELGEEPLLTGARVTELPGLCALKCVCVCVCVCVCACVRMCTCMCVGPLHQVEVQIQVVPVEKEVAPHSSTLAWKIPGMGELGGLQSMGSRRVGHD